MKKQIEDLTLLLLHLTSFEDEELPQSIRRSWKGYPFWALDALAEQDYLRGTKGSKSVYITERGSKQAEALKSHYLPEKAKDDSLPQLLKTKSRQELLELLLGLAKTSETVEEHLTYKLKSLKPTIEESRAFIQSYLRKYGPLEADNIDFAIEGVDIVLAKVHEKTATHEYIDAFQLARLAIEETLPLIEESINIDFPVEMRLNEASETIRKLCQLSATHAEEAEKVYLYDEAYKLAQWVEKQGCGDWQEVLFEGCAYLGDVD